MPAVALAAAAGLGGLLLSQAFSALSGQRAQTARAQRNARSASSAAADAAADAKKARGEASKLKKALELSRKQDKAEAQSDGSKGAAPVQEPKLHDVPPTPPEPAKAETLTQLGTEQPTKRDWAERLYAYASREIREGRSANLGSKGNPNAQVKAAQSGMGKIAADGIYGDKTRARGKELLGKPFPARQSTKAAAAAAPAKPKVISDEEAKALAQLAAVLKPKPEAAKPATSKPKAAKPAAAAKPSKPAAAPVQAKRSPLQAAEELRAYATEAVAQGKQSSRLGTKASPSDFVAAAQRDMGGIAADGIYGPGTRARGRELTGKPFPARI